jgi:hypothetical protein
MNPSSLDELKFLLKLQECRNYRAYLSHPGLKAFRAKDKICQNLAKDGLVDFSREIVTVKPSAAGLALLSVTGDLPISALELKLLKKIAAAKKINLSQLRTAALSAAQRDASLQSFLNRGLIEVETRLKRQQAEVWLTPVGQSCLGELLNQFQTFRQFSHPAVPAHPSDAEVLEIIQTLDQEVISNNYLPLFYLRQKLQAALSREALDEILYRLEQNDQIELRAIVHTESYEPEQLSAGIQTRTGSLLFFVKVI